MIASLSPGQFFLASVVVVVGAVLQGAVGSGLGLIAAPLLALVSTSLVPGPLLLCGMWLTILMSYRDWKSLDLLVLKWGAPGRLLGTILAAGVLSCLPTEDMSVLFAGIVLFAIVLSVSGLTIEPTRKMILAAGVLSGIMGTLTSLGGPPMALLYQNASGKKVRATLSAYFVCGTLISVLGLVAVGNFGVGELLLALVLFPAVAVGFLLSARAIPFLDRGYTRAAILLISAASCIVLIVRAFL